jgi:hypothetical protein
MRLVAQAAARRGATGFVTTTLSQEGKEVHCG